MTTANPIAKKKPVEARPKRALTLGEDSTWQIKRDVTNTGTLGEEMVAFANAEGGAIFMGVADEGTTTGLSADDVKRLNQFFGGNEEIAQSLRGCG